MINVQHHPKQTARPSDTNVCHGDDVNDMIDKLLSPTHQTKLIRHRFYSGNLSSDKWIVRMQNTRTC